MDGYCSVLEDCVRAAGTVPRPLRQAGRLPARPSRLVKQRDPTPAVVAVVVVVVVAGVVHGGAIPVEVAI